MPLPQVLASLIRSFGDKFQPNSERAEYKAYAETWRLYLDLLEMDATKLGDLLERHSDETDERFTLRKSLAAIFNYVPTLVRMTVNYLHAEQPVYTIADERLKTFVNNCDGGGRSLQEYVRREALPFALLFGFIDTLVQNPPTDSALFETAADVQIQGQELTPRVMTITPLQRTDWSCRRDHTYNWVRFRDHENEDDIPFRAMPIQGETFVTVSAFVLINKSNGEDASIRPDTGGDVGFWVRSFQEASATEGAASSQGAGKGKDWLHDGDFHFTKRCPVATLYYQQSIDPDRRHHGISKIAMIAILTRKIVQLLSWTDEDVLSNLAIFVFSGNKPVDEKGVEIPIKLTPFSVIWQGRDAKVPPSILQGSVDHIKIKWDIINAYIQEILRLAFLIGASAQAEKISSGVQGVVARNELFQELGDIAGSLDAYALDVLALAASHISTEDLTREAFIAKYQPKVIYNKGPYTVDPLDQMILNSNALIEAFADISPTMVRQIRMQLAQAALYNEDGERQTIFDEIRAGTGAELTRRAQQRDALNTELNNASLSVQTVANSNNPLEPTVTETNSPAAAATTGA